MRDVTLTVNDVPHELELDPRELLVYVLRERLGLNGTVVGCDTSSCGSCTVLLDGESVKSCTLLGVQADGHEITTVEGLAENGSLNPLQESFHAHHALQCGYCTSGMLLAATSLLARIRARAKTRFARRSRETSAAAPGIRTSSMRSRRWRDDRAGGDRGRPGDRRPGRA